MKKKPPHRLPKGVVEKLHRNTGGGRHTDKKNAYVRKQKHPKREK